MIRPKYNQLISERIKRFQEGDVFITSDFSDVATVSAINMSLSRLLAEKKIRRIIRGIYEKPKYNRMLKEYVTPDIEKVASAIARNYNWSIAPSGETALNLLKISTQIPAIWSYVSDGPYKEYEYDGIKIKFKHAAQKETSGLSYMTALIIQGIKAIGKENISKKEINKIKSILLEKDKKSIVMEAHGTTAWIYEVIKKVTE